jgi:diadenylate cyclase
MAEAGVMIDARLTPELLETIFTPKSPLHDGAAIVRHDRVIAASVVLPLSDLSSSRERMGTRHRAALGITEQTDAIVVVVSEETGQISLVERGRIVRNLDEDRLRRGIIELLEHNTLSETLSAARIPQRASAIRKTVSQVRPTRRKTTTSSTTASATGEAATPQSAAPAGTTGRAE